MMKILMAALAMMMIAGVAGAQEVPIVVADVEICFPDAYSEADRAWFSPDPVTISYSMEPVGTHSKSGPIGLQKWEGYLQDDDHTLGKAVMEFDLTWDMVPSKTSNPDGPPCRSYWLRWRVMYEGHIGKSPYSDYSDYKLIGKPGKAIVPEEFMAPQNYPNPFNPETWIPYGLSEASEVVIRIYNINGELVRTLGLGHKPPGMYDTMDRAAYWDGRSGNGELVGSGVYFYLLQAGKSKAIRKMVVVR